MCAGKSNNSVPRRIRAGKSINVGQGGCVLEKHLKIPGRICAENITHVGQGGCELKDSAKAERAGQEKGARHRTGE